MLAATFAVGALSLASFTASAWCVINGTKSGPGVVVEVATTPVTTTTVTGAETTPAKLLGALADGKKVCDDATDKDGATIISIALNVAPGTADCAANAKAPCVKTCANDPRGFNTLGAVDTTIKFAETGDALGQYKKGDLIAEYVFRSGKASDTVPYACRAPRAL